MLVNLTNRQLARVDVDKVKTALQVTGFFLQLPPPTENLLDIHKQQKAQSRQATAD
jgi:uncharacterized protein YcgL (UPF0745 family)